MAIPTFPDLFGGDSFLLTKDTMVFASETDAVLIIPKTSFVDWTTSSPQKPERWIAAILTSLTAFDARENTDIPDIECTLAAKILSTRNGVDKMGFIFQATVYQPISGLPTSPDSDLV